MTFVTHHDNVFYMRDKSFGKSFSLLSTMIKEYCALSLNPYLPHNEEVCLGKFTGKCFYSCFLEIHKKINLFNFRWYVV